MSKLPTIGGSTRRWRSITIFGYRVRWGYSAPLMFEGLKLHKETLPCLHVWLKEHLQYLLNLSKRDYV